MARKKKTCSTCLNDLVLATNFNKDARNKDGYRYDCKLCQYKGQVKHLNKKIEKMEEQRNARARS